MYPRSNGSNSSPDGNFIPFNSSRSSNFTPSPRFNNPMRGFRGNQSGRKPRFSTPYQSNNTTPYQRNNGSPLQRNNNQMNHSHFSKSHTQNSFHKNRSQDFQQNGGRTPLKEIPIEKFITPGMMQDPWADLMSNDELMDATVDVPSKSKRITSSPIQQNDQEMSDKDSSIDSADDST